MHSKIIEKNENISLLTIKEISEIAVKIPAKYSLNPEELLHLDKVEENALFSYLLNEFFKQIEKHRILARECISELSFLCESYFDFRDLTEQTDLEDEFEPIYSEY